MDLDGDGQLDLLSGSWPGDIYLFRRKADGTFARGEILCTREGQPLRVGRASTVFAVDWHSTGLLDLVIGTMNGEVYLVRNEGTPRCPRFGKPRMLLADGQPLRIQGGDAAPAVADWDGDGKLDLIIGSSDGTVLWYRNEGTADKLKLAAGQVLLAPANDARADCGPGHRSKVCVVDWNDDGRLDLLVGDFHVEQPRGPRPLTLIHGWVWLYERQPLSLK